MSNDIFETLNIPGGMFEYFKNDLNLCCRCHRDIDQFRILKRPLDIPGIFLVYPGINCAVTRVVSSVLPHWA